MTKLGFAYYHWSQFEYYYDYIDAFGRLWVARNRWDLFRKKENSAIRKLRKQDDRLYTGIWP